MIDAGLSNRGHFARQFWQNIEIVITKRLRNLGGGKFVLPHYARSENKQRPLPCDMMEGFLAGLIMIACGEATGGSASVYPAFSQLLNNVEAPLVYGGTDVDLVTGTETPPHIIQSETYSTANPDDPNEICVGFNDSRGATVNQFSGLSCSTDGGATWANTYTGSPFAGPGVQACSDNTYFTCMFPDQIGFWRHEGWGEPAALNGVVHLYMRSTVPAMTLVTSFISVPQIMA